MYHIRIPNIEYVMFNTPLPANQRFDMVLVNGNGNAAQMTYDEVKADGRARLATHFQRPEDAAWDTTVDGVFYVATTTLPRIYRFELDDVTQPELGGRVSVLVDGRLSNEQRSFDNVAASPGRLLVTSDTTSPFNRLWEVAVGDGAVRAIGVQSPERFGDAAVAPMAPFTRSGEMTYGCAPRRRAPH